MRANKRSVMLSGIDYKLKEHQQDIIGDLLIQIGMMIIIILNTILLVWTQIMLLAMLITHQV